MSDGDVVKGSGCLVTAEDKPKVFYSFVYFVTFLVYGASATVLGAAMPSLSSDFHRSKSQFGLGFTSRGIGYLVGTILSAYLLQIKALADSKGLLTAVSLLITGVATSVVTLSTNFPLAIIMFFIQGIGFGGIDTMGNCGLPEMWGKRVQPWMQAMHSCFGLGGIVGPAMVGSIGYVSAFRIVGLMSFGPVLTLCIPYVIQSVGNGSLRQEGWNSLHDGEAERVIELSTVKHQLADETGLNNETSNKSDKVESTEEEGKQIIAPFHIRMLVAFFFFIYVGAETGYAGWVASYAILIDVTDNKSKAAYLSAIFWALLTVGRILAVPCAVYFSATTMIRAQLALIVMGALFVPMFFSISYTSACWVTGFIGFALSSIFPVMMTIFSDYGFTMDPNTTSTFMVGATVGESIIPVIIGLAIGLVGASSFPVAIIVSAFVLLGIYLLASHLCREYMKKLNDDGLLTTTGGASTHPLQPLHTILGEDDDDQSDDSEAGDADDDGDRPTYSRVEHDDLVMEDSNSHETLQRGPIDREQLSREVHEYLNDGSEDVVVLHSEARRAPNLNMYDQPISSPFHKDNPFHVAIPDALAEHEFEFSMVEDDEEVHL